MTIKLVFKPFLMYNTRMSHVPTNARSDLIQRVKKLVMQSVALKNIEKGRVLKQLDGLTEAQLKQMEMLFLNEQKQAETLLKQRFKDNPQLAISHDRKMYKITRNTYNEAERRDRVKESENLDDIFNELDE